jgi:hypothetical protein
MKSKISLADKLNSCETSILLKQVIFKLHDMLLIGIVLIWLIRDLWLLSLKAIYIINLDTFIANLACCNTTPSVLWLKHCSTFFDKKTKINFVENNYNIAQFLRASTHYALFGHSLVFCLLILCEAIEFGTTFLKARSTQCF